MTSSIAKIGGQDLSYVTWSVPQFEENYDTCDLDKYSDDKIKLEENIEVNGLIDLLKQGYADKSVSFVSTVFKKWVGHGDYSDEVTYKLYDGKFIPVEALVDNCNDERLTRM